ncbi:MAG: hypothetical protein JWO36_2371 [Myxococcales bacterium]|nr:hypothetical protein [Myxococcales bacterium]
MESLIENLTRVLQAGPPLRLAVMFGSHARGQNRAGSDVDIAILPWDSSLPLKLELDLVARISTGLGREVDLVRIDQASTLLRWEIARDGVLLFADSPAEWVRFRANTASEHAEIRDALEQAAELFRRRIAGPTP